MALGYLENDLTAQAQENAHARSRGALISSWIDNISLEFSRDSSQQNRDRAGAARGFTPMARRAMDMLTAETQKGTAQGLNSRPRSLATPAYCHRILNNGAAAVAEGHPWACACSYNEHLQARDLAHVPHSPIYAKVHASMQNLDTRQKYLDTITSCCSDASYSLDRFGIVSHNPFRQAEPSDFMFHNGKFRISSAMEESVAAVCHMIDATFASTYSLGEAFLEKQMVLHALYCVLTIFVSPLPHGILTFTMVNQGRQACTGEEAAWCAYFETLRQYINSTGILNGIDSHELIKLRMVDIDGSIFFGVPPNLPYTRRYQLLPCVLPTRDMERILTILRPRLQACNIDIDASDTIIAACIFIWTMRVTREHDIKDRFDCGNVMEDYDFLQCDLLHSSQPNVSKTGSLVPRRMGAHYSDWNKDAPTARDYLTTFRDALRITTLMCLRAPKLQVPWSKWTYSGLLAQLVDCLQYILDWICETADDCSYINPALLHGPEENKTLLVGSARPFLIWMCMIGHQLSVYYGVYHAGWSSQHPKACVYVKLLDALGIRDNADIGAMSDSDLIIFHTLNLSWATENEHGAQDILRSIVS